MGQSHTQTHDHCIKGSRRNSTTIVASMFGISEPKVNFCVAPMLIARLSSMYSCVRSSRLASASIFVWYLFASAILFSVPRDASRSSSSQSPVEPLRCKVFGHFDRTHILFPLCLNRCTLTLRLGIFLHNFLTLCLDHQFRFQLPSARNFCESAQEFWVWSHALR